MGIRVLGVSGGHEPVLVRSWLDALGARQSARRRRAPGQPDLGTMASAHAVGSPPFALTMPTEFFVDGPGLFLATAMTESPKGNRQGRYLSQAASSARTPTRIGLSQPKPCGRGLTSDWGSGRGERCSHRQAAARGNRNALAYVSRSRTRP